MKHLLTRALSAVTIASLGFVPTQVQAIEIFYGEDLNANINFLPNGNAAQAQNDFLNRLSGVSTEDFERFTPEDTGPLSLVFTGDAGTINASLSGSNRVRSGFLSNGIFPTSGNQFWFTVGSFSVDFGTTPIAAFGFFATDIEFNRPILTLDLVGGGQKQLTIPATVPSRNGGLAFYGFIDTDQPFTRVTFSNATSGEGFAFDDLTVGNINQVKPVPEPLTLLGAATAVAFGTAFKRKLGKAKKTVSHRRK